MFTETLDSIPARITFFERSSDIWTHTAGPEDPHTLASIHNLALTLGGEGRYPEAEKLEAHNLEVYRRVFGHSVPRRFGRCPDSPSRSKMKDDTRKQKNSRAKRSRFPSELPVLKIPILCGS